MKLIYASLVNDRAFSGTVKISCTVRVVLCAVLILVNATDGVDQTCFSEARQTMAGTALTRYSTITSRSSAAGAAQDDGISSAQDLQQDVSSIPPATSTEIPPSSSQLSTPIKAGIITASILVFLLVLLLVLEHTYLRRKRHERAVKRAIDEVERGTELKNTTTSESKENMVLESRVEIVVDGEVQDSVRGSWDREGHWNVDTDDEDDDGNLSEWGRGRRRDVGRNGMSLPRRGR